MKMNAKYISREVLSIFDYSIIGRTPNSEVYYDLHYHDFYEVQIYTSKAGVLNIRGKEYDISRGNIALLNIFEPHQLIINPDLYTKRFCCSFNGDFLLNASSEKTNILGIFSDHNPNYPILHLKENELAQYISLLYRFESNSLVHGNDIMEKSILYELLALIYNTFYYDQIADANVTGVNETVFRLVEYINNNLSESLLLDELAQNMNFSKYYLCRIFKKITGFTINKYIVHKRINKSKYLLRSGMPIGEASRAVGFNNYSHFYKTFIQLEGMTPSEFKGKNRVEENNVKM